MEDKSRNPGCPPKAKAGRRGRGSRPPTIRVFSTGSEPGPLDAYSLADLSAIADQVLAAGMGDEDSGEAVPLLRPDQRGVNHTAAIKEGSHEATEEPCHDGAVRRGATGGDVGVQRSRRDGADAVARRKRGAEERESARMSRSGLAGSTERSSHTRTTRGTGVNR